MPAPHHLLSSRKVHYADVSPKSRIAYDDVHVYPVKTSHMAAWRMQRGMRKLLPVPGTVWLPSWFCHLKVLEVETRRDRAADERPVTQRLGVLPFSPLHDDLWSLAVAHVGPEKHVADRFAVVPGERESERGSGIVMPDLDGVEDAMPMRQACLALEEVVDVGAWRTTLG